LRIRGNTIAGVLSWIQYSATDLEKKVKEQIEAKVREGLIKPREGVELQNFYEEVLHGYTYMDPEKQSRFLSMIAESSHASRQSLEMQGVGVRSEELGSSLLN